MDLLSRAATCLCLLFAAWALSGCSGYKLQGKVVQGAVSTVEVVAADDPRFDQPGLGGARVSLVLDPHQLNRKHAGTAQTGSDGTFAIPVEEVGAGLLEYETQVVARAEDHRPAEGFFHLPRSSRRLLITLTPGEDAVPRRQRDFLEETMRMGQPYMTE